MAWSDLYLCPKVMFIAAPFGRDAFSGVIISLPMFLTKYYSLTLKITASVIHANASGEPIFGGLLYQVFRECLVFSLRSYSHVRVIHPCA